MLTTRPTGFRKIQGVELECEHLQGEIMDFDRQQQETFLNRWFKAVSLKDLSGDGAMKEKREGEKRAKDKAAAIIEYLNREKNKSIGELARVPMLLQIMAIIWKDREFLPGSRSELYDKSLDYLLDYRDRRRKIYPLLPAETARKALAPAALWLQETKGSDNAPAEEIHEFLKPILDTLDKQPRAEEFCANLRDRAGLLADYGEGSYIFRHKSFMEYLAGLQLVKECTAEPGRVADAAGYFFDPYWEETLRFFFSKSDDDIFDRFMGAFFEAPASGHLDAHRQDLLQYIVKDAPQKRLDSLVRRLMKPGLDDNRGRYILTCLKTIATPDAIEAIKAFMKEGEVKTPLREYAEDIREEYAAEIAAKNASGQVIPGEIKSVAEQLAASPASFRNPFEDNVEYIHISGGSYSYSVTGKEESVPGIYFCKYPVTNKRYRRFIAYLRGEEKDLLKRLPMGLFSEKLIEFSSTISGYSDYIGKEPEEWQGKLRSEYDEDKRFKGDDQPVVGVTWYAARAYCLWLSCLQAAAKGGSELPGMDKLAGIFRLPTEVEWEWAAAGREADGSLREYPWPKKKGKPVPELANFGKNVGATTPVDRYPEGATPEGLMDMAGNVWEWMNNYYDKDKDSYALRGGAWYSEASSLCCGSRDSNVPVNAWGGYIGFRVVCPNP